MLVPEYHPRAATRSSAFGRRPRSVGRGVSPLSNVFSTGVLTALYSMAIAQLVLESGGTPTLKVVDWPADKSPFVTNKSEMTGPRFSVVKSADSWSASLK